ncbi:orcokinin [Musca autumnalis]|uniref:orcokinin n=1 Tax=Musca autumnalis TaxID=221902 RepID=UPI003CF841FF
MNFYLLSVLLLAAYTMAMPQKTPISSEEEYATIRGNPLHDRYQMFLIAPVRTDDHQRHSLDAIRAYLNSVNADSTQMLRRLLLSKLIAQCENQNKSLRSNLCSHLLEEIYYTPELQIPSDGSKIKKNFDEIDKASASFSTLNQLI